RLSVWLYDETGTTIGESLVRSLFNFDGTGLWDGPEVLMAPRFIGRDVNRGLYWIGLVEPSTLNEHGVFVNVDVSTDRAEHSNVGAMKEFGDRIMSAVMAKINVRTGDEG